MNPEHPAAYKKAINLCSYLGHPVTVTKGPHEGKVGCLKSLTQPDYRDPLMEYPDEPRIPYATISWPEPITTTDPFHRPSFLEEYHDVREVELYSPEAKVSIPEKSSLVVGKLP
jgi:hypothetical protein